MAVMKKNGPALRRAIHCAKSDPLAAHMTRAVDHATGRRFDPFTDQSTVITIKGVAVAPEQYDLS